MGALCNLQQRHQRLLGQKKNCQVFLLVSAHLLLIKNLTARIRNIMSIKHVLSLLTLAFVQVLSSSDEVKALEERVQQLEGQIQSLLKTQDQCKHLQCHNNHGSKKYPEVPYLSQSQGRKKILVTGGAGFVGSHLTDRLLMQGNEVIVADNFYTGGKRNLEHWVGHPNFDMINHDIVNPLYLHVDEIYHLASPASPPHYMFNPVKTVKTNTVGVINMLGLAKRVGAKFLLASTSEVYGDPVVHPQPETYWGNVNPIGPRACYDEGKRIAETLVSSYDQMSNVSVRIARIFNTYGPRMNMNDGRVASNFIYQALQKNPITVYGEGSQTRSFQYIDDLIDGLTALMNSDYTKPVNIGNPDEYKIKDFAELIQQAVAGQLGAEYQSKIVYQPDSRTMDDPQRRRPDIGLAKKILGWKPKVSVQEGVRKTIEHFKSDLDTSSLSEFVRHSHRIFDDDL